MWQTHRFPTVELKLAPLCWHLNSQLWHSTLTTAAHCFVHSHFFFSLSRIKCKHPDFMSHIMTNGQCCERAMTLPFVKLSQNCDINTKIVWPENENADSICIEARVKLK